MMQATSTWPRQRPVLTEQQHEILEDWYGFWLNTMPDRYSAIVRFNQEYPARTAVPGARTLEIGAGTGEHLLYEDASSQEYFALELRQELTSRLLARFPEVNTIIGDCQKRIDAPDKYFDRVLAIHLLEHLPDLPKALDEVTRVLRPGGKFSVVIPCEGGFGYWLGRQFSSKRVFEQRYGISYDWLISYDHVNRAAEILHELESRFLITDSSYFPTRIPSIDLNLVIGLTLTPRPDVQLASPDGRL